MRNELTTIKQHLGLAERCLQRADREWAYYKNGQPLPNGTVDFSNSKGHYMSSQKSYASAKEYAEKVLQELKGFNELELERRAKSVIAKCNYNK